MSLTGAPETVTGRRRIRPFTALLVVFALLLFLWQLFVAAIASAPLFGVTPARDDYFLGGMACLTTLPAFAAMSWCGWQRGSRRGLWPIGGLAAVMALVGLNMLTITGGSRGPDPSAGPVLRDLFGRTTQINWVLFVGFGWFALMTELFRWRARHAQDGSAA